MGQVVLGIYLMFSVFSCFMFWASLVLAKKADHQIRSSFKLSENNHPDQESGFEIILLSANLKYKKRKKIRNEFQAEINRLGCEPVNNYSIVKNDICFLI